MAATQRRIGAFTLIELMVVVAIIALLISILLPSLNKARENGRRAACLSNLHHLGIAFEQYFNDYDHVLPEAAQAPSLNPEDPNDDGYHAPIMEFLKPYARSDGLFRCPSDMPGRSEREPDVQGMSYWQTDGTSYEYNFLPSTAAELLSVFGIRVKIDVGDSFVKWNFPIPIPESLRQWFAVRTSDVYLLYGLDNYHGKRGSREVRPTLYADRHVEEYFRLPFGVDPNAIDDPNYLEPDIGGID
jgi:prepilin-type N-terminal cleavage/methylation domain-containing protein